MYIKFHQEILNKSTLIKNDKILYLIPARGGSKGLINKNIKLLGGKPLIYYSIKAALEIASSHDICVSTDSQKIKEVAEQSGIKVPFIRPSKLASDTATTEEVTLHALDYYKTLGIHYDFVVVLQPTSPFRTGMHIIKAINLINDETDLIVSVKETDSNPYYVLFEEDDKGVLNKTCKGVFTRRQDCPKVFELNGAIYVIRVKELIKKGYQNLPMKKLLMSKRTSLDIDDDLDLKFAEVLMNSDRH